MYHHMETLEIGLRIVIVFDEAKIVIPNSMFYF